MKKLHHQNTISIFILIFIFTTSIFLSPPTKITYAGEKKEQTPDPFGDLKLKERMGGKEYLDGEEAIKALGGDIVRVAEYYGKSDKELKEALKNDHTLKVHYSGKLFFSDLGPEKSSPGDGTISNNPVVADIPNALTFTLHSKPQATAKIYLDFDGAITKNPNWNNGNAIVSAPYSRDSDPAFSSQELNDIKTIWRSVAEDYIPFNVDVTTEQPSSPDLGHYAHAILSPTTWGNSGAGVAFTGSFRWGDATPAFIFTNPPNNDIKNIAEASSHEVGHTLGLAHVALYDANCALVSLYNPGHGNPGWAPIMGVSYYKQVTHWANTNDSPLMATPYGCTSEQVDTSIITGTSSQGGDLRWATDEAGNTVATATNLPHTTALNGEAFVDHLGILTLNDTDVYKINTIAGDLNFTVLPMNPIGTIYGNADFRVRLLNSNFAVVASQSINPDRVAPATVTAVGVSAGIYYIEISTSGYLTPTQDGGYSKAGSMGNYQVTGTYMPNNPAVYMTTPASGSTVSDSVYVSGNAVAGVGVSKVEFYNGTTLIGTDTDAPYSVNWYTYSLDNGPYTLSAKGYDTTNNVGTSTSVSVIVNNPKVPNNCGILYDFKNPSQSELYQRCIVLFKSGIVQPILSEGPVSESQNSVISPEGDSLATPMP